MKPTQEQIIAWVQEAEWTGIYSQLVSPTEREHLTVPVTMEQIKRAFTFAYEAGRKSIILDGIHSCHDQCDRPTCVAVRKAYEAGRKDENEACAKQVGQQWDAFEELKAAHYRNSPEPFDPFRFHRDLSTIFFSRDMAAAIRARREQ